MSDQFVGFVKKVFQKSGTAKTGRPYTLFSAKLQDKDGNEYPEFFQFGFEPIGAKEGDYVQVTGIREGTAIKVDKGSLKVSKNPPAQPAPKQSSPHAATGGSKGSRDDYWTDKGKRDIEVVEPRITFSASRTAAIELVGILSKEDALPISAASGKASKAKRYEEILAIVDKLTVRFYHDAFAGAKSRVLANVADEGAVSVGGDGDLPGADEFEGGGSTEARDAEESQFADGAGNEFD